MRKMIVCRRGYGIGGDRVSVGLFKKSQEGVTHHPTVDISPV
jgi:hypothetical protein